LKEREEGSERESDFRERKKIKGERYILGAK
jgi:hypothetical protein